MKKVTVVVLALMAVSAQARNLGNGTHSVDGYTRSTGTYVAPHLSANAGSGKSCSGGYCY